MAITQFFSHDCPTCKKEKAILKVKYEKSITFPEARKLVEEQFAAPGKSYASITKVAGVHVSCTDAQTQTDETCIAELKSATSNAGSKPTLAPPLSGMAQIKMGVVPSTSAQPKPAETKSTPNAKDKVDTGRTAKGSDDPIKTHNRYGAFNEDDMETEVSPSSPRKVIINKYLQLDTYSSIQTIALTTIFRYSLITSRHSWKNRLPGGNLLKLIGHHSKLFVKQR